jgi:hypothetical protein
MTLPYAVSTVNSQARVLHRVTGQVFRSNIHTISRAFFTAQRACPFVLSPLFRHLSVKAIQNGRHIGVESDIMDKCRRSVPAKDL